MADTKILNEVADSRYNNLNMMRFIAAVMVIVSHSVPICNGELKDDILGVYTNGVLNLGGIAVGVFFVTGGYLIAKSSERNGHAVPFFLARIKRIFPSLAAVIILCTFVLGPVLTTMNLTKYFGDTDTYKYLINIILIPVHSLPGVFENNIYPNVVNGPLWTLPVEFLCYIGCFCVYKLGFFQTKRYSITIPLVMLMAIGFFSVFHNNIFLIRIMRPILLYYIGIGYYVFRDRIRISIKYGLVAILLFFLSIALNLSIIGMLLFFPYMIYVLAYGIKGKTCEFGKRYEISYGMYLWGWPIQQILSGKAAGLFSDWYMNAAAATAIAIILGLLNHILVERHIGIKKKKSG